MAQVGDSRIVALVHGFGDDSGQWLAVQGKVTAMMSSELRPFVEEAAEKEIIPRYHHAKASIKADGSLVTEADIAVQGRIKADLAKRWPGIQFLGEEMDPEGQLTAVEAGRFWCLDPLDGTTNFLSGLPYFCISIALIEQGRVVSGVVYDPIREECFRADVGEGAWLNDQPLYLASSSESLEESIALIDFKRLPPGLITRLAGAPPYRSQRNFGAIALEWCWLAAGRIDLYLHGSQKLWDYAAGSLILGEAGGSARLFTCVGGAVTDGLDLAPKAAIGATSSALLQKWDGWIRGAPGDLP